MDNPASRGDGTSGSFCRRITKYGTTKYDLEEVSHHFRGDGPGHGTYRKRSRSTSPGHRFDRAGLDDRVGRITSSDNMSHRTSNFPCKFFASGNCRYGNFCRFPHNDQTRDSFNYYKPDDHAQGIGEQRALISSADDHVVSDNRYMAHSSSGMGVSGPVTEQIFNLTRILTRLLEEGIQLPELYAALSATNALGFLQSSVSGSAGPDVPAVSSRQYDPVTDSIELIRSVIGEEKDGIAVTSELFHTGDPVGDGLYGTDFKEVELNANSLHSSEKAPLAGCKNEEQSILKAEEMKEWKDGDNLANNEGDGKAAEIKNNDGKSLQPSEKAPFADCKNQEHSIVRVEEIKKGQDGGTLGNNEGDDKAEIKKNNDGKSLRAFKFALAEFVKELLSPTWNEGQINKEAYKTIVKKVVCKVIASVQSIYIPGTKEKIDNYISAAKPKILKLVQAYIERAKEENSNVA